ncbi:MAG: hypothetical protein EU548_09850 [Promethearchaeota archaeon]|nr:MAG: hypothetical protein EU548_09850 [Candidatus Lokiarchaeota archaeon]
MIISSIIVIGCFLGVIFLILTERLNRAIASLMGAIITYFVLLIFEGMDFSIIVDLIFGSNEEGFVNLHSLILILGMMIIVVIAHEAGTFQFIAIKLIKLSKGKPIRLLVVLCSITVLISALLNNILTVIILIPLTITVSRMLNTDPTPYILTEAVLVNIGGTIFSISSIPNILITTYANISFLDFLVNVGLISLIIFGFTIILFILLYKDELIIPEEGKRVLSEFNIWNVVQNKRLLYQSTSAIIIVMLLFISIPSTIIPPDIIALTVALILVIISKLEPKDIISKVDFELLLYLMGIFVIAGAFEILGVTDFLGSSLFNLGTGDIFLQLILILWISSFLSSTIDNIPITKVLIPVIDSIPGTGSSIFQNQKFYSLAIGANWGDNLTPLGDNILVVNLAEQNKRPISFKQFFKIGFISTIFQLTLATIIFTLMFKFIIGIIIFSIICLGIITLIIIYKFAPKAIVLKIDQNFKKFRNKIIK